jgi:lipopolysaccharide export system permease protein
MLMLFRLPEFLMIIVPFAWFLAILLAYGRMYADNELVVLHACGFSRKSLLSLTMGIATILTLIMALVSFYIAPTGLQETERLRQSQEELTEIDLIVAGQFQAFAQGSRVTYAEAITETGQGRQLNNAFVVLRDSGSAQDGGSGLRVMVADTARPVMDEESGRRYMLLENGHFYDGQPGQGNYAVTEFDVQGILLPDATSIAPVLRVKAMPTLQLLGSSDMAHTAELQWRISVVCLLPVLTLLGVPLSKVDPRQGRFARLVPAALLYGLYFMLLQVSRDALEDGDIPAVVGLWWVHVVFGIAGLYLVAKERASFRRAANHSARLAGEH